MLSSWQEVNLGEKAGTRGPVFVCDIVFQQARTNQAGDIDI